MDPDPTAGPAPARRGEASEGEAPARPDAADSGAPPPETPPPGAASPHDAADHILEPGRVALRWVRARPEAVWIALLAAVVRGAAAWTNPALVRDSVSLLETAATARRAGPAAIIGLPHHPLPPYLISLAPDGISLETFAVVLGVLAGAIAVLPLHALVRHVSGRHAATAAGVLYAALPEAVAVAAVPLSEGIYVPFAILTLSLVLSARVPCRRFEWIARLLLAGLAGGCAYLCRPEGLVMAAAAVVLAATVRRRGRRLLGAALVAIGVALPAVPYVAKLSADHGRLVLSPKKDLARFAGARPLAGSRPAGTAAPATAPAAEPGTGHAGAPGAADGASAAATSPPGRKSLAAAVRGTLAGLERALTLPGILLLLFGAFAHRRWRRGRLRWPRTIVVGTALVLSALVVRLHVGWGYGGGRHMLTVALLLIGFAGEGIHRLGAFIPRITTRRRLTLVTALLIALPTGVRSVLRPPGEGGVDARELGRRLAAIAREGDAAPGAQPGAGASAGPLPPVPPVPPVRIATFGEPRVAYYLRAAAPGTRAEDVRLVGRHGRVLLRGGELPGARAALVQTLRSEGVTWLVLDAFDRGPRDEEGPSRALIRRLVEDGAVARAADAGAGRLVALRVRRE